MPWKFLKDIFARRLEGVLKTSWRRLGDFLNTILQDVLKTFWSRLKDVLKTSGRRLQNVLKMLLQDVLKKSSKRLEDVLKTSWKRLEDVFEKYGQDEYTGLDRDVLKTSWKRFLKTKTKDVFKTSSRRLHRGECLLGYYLIILILLCWKMSPMFACFREKLAFPTRDTVIDKRKMFLLSRRAVSRWSHNSLQEN